VVSEGFELGPLEFFTVAVVFVLVGLTVFAG
jgi:hypothetical protein